MTFSDKNFAVQGTLAGGKTLYEINAENKLCAIVSFANDPYALALLGSMISTIARDGGTVIDRDTNEYLAGSLDQLVGA